MNYKLCDICGEKISDDYKTYLDYYKFSKEIVENYYNKYHHTKEYNLDICDKCMNLFREFVSEKNQKYILNINNMEDTE